MYLLCLVFKPRTKLWLEILSTEHVELDDFFLTADNSWGRGGWNMYEATWYPH